MKTRYIELMAKTLTAYSDSHIRAYFDEVLEGELWQELSAVKEGRYYYLSKELSQYKPNSAWYDAYLELWEILYGNEK